MAAVGTPKTMAFANTPIPKDAPASVPLKTEFKNGETIHMRVFFEKTFGDFMKAESAVQYNVYAYQKNSAGKWDELAHEGSINIDQDMLAWKGFQKEIPKQIMSKLSALPKGKHSIKLMVFMGVPTPGAKDNVLKWEGNFLRTIKLVTTTFGSTAASGEFTFLT